MPYDVPKLFVVRVTRSDVFAVAKEAALFEQTMRNYVLSIQFEKQHTLFSIIYDGKIVTSENENIGYEALAKAISQKYSLPESVAAKKLIKHGRLAQTEFIDRPVYMWTANQVTNMITDRDLFETLKETADYIASDFQSLCDPILQQENVTVMVSGDGVEIEGVDKVQMISKDATPLLEGIKDWNVGYFDIDENDGRLFVRAEMNERPF